MTRQGEKGKEEEEENHLFILVLVWYWWENMAEDNIQMKINDDKSLYLLLFEEWCILTFIFYLVKIIKTFEFNSLLFIFSIH